MTNQDKLNGLSTEFQQWRLTRKYPKERTPQRLKYKVVKLAQHYSSSQIKTALNIADLHFTTCVNKQLPSMSELILLPSRKNLTLYLVRSFSI